MIRPVTFVTNATATSQTESRLQPVDELEEMNLAR